MERRKPPYLHRVLKARKREAHSSLDIDDVDAECGQRAQGETQKRESDIDDVVGKGGVRRRT